jgi:UDP-N-acetylglucosamine diphosphorylase/glucosamine-1-phosphate N-acetyltransferase
MNFVLFDDEASWKNLLPLTFTRPVSEIRIGILTIREKWEKSLGQECSYFTKDYLSLKYPFVRSGPAIFINSTLLPAKEIVQQILQLKAGEAIVNNDELIAYHSDNGAPQPGSKLTRAEAKSKLQFVKHVWDIFQQNGDAIKNDFRLLTEGRKSRPVSDTVTVIGDRSQVFLEEGAKAEACILNTKDGPVYVGEHAELMEGSVVRGPFALCSHSTLKLSTKIYGATTIGPHCKVGGEVSNSVIFGYSNKAHDGFLGNSVVGEWCNLGADTNNSNLKNNYGNVKLYNYASGRLVDTGLQFCGLIMGDHSKSGINTMFNTGTVVGVGSNIFGGGFPSTNIMSFSWGGSGGFEPYKLDKLFETAEKVFQRRGLVFDDKEKAILSSVYQGTVGG